MESSVEQRPFLVDIAIIMDRTIMGLVSCDLVLRILFVLFLNITIASLVICLRENLQTASGLDFILGFSWTVMKIFDFCFPCSIKTLKHLYRKHILKCPPKAFRYGSIYFLCLRGCDFHTDFGISEWCAFLIVLSGMQGIIVHSQFVFVLEWPFRRYHKSNSLLIQ